MILKSNHRLPLEWQLDKKSLDQEIKNETSDEKVFLNFFLLNQGI